MTTTNVLPSSYAQWRQCITRSGQAALSLTYLEQRLRTLSDIDQEETRTFRYLYGDGHWRAVLAWFDRARREFN